MSTNRSSQEDFNPGSYILDPLQASPYKPLDKSKSEIRLLEILNVSEKATICQLHIVSLPSAPVFTALSYVWGDPRVTENIFLGGNLIAVTINLAAALKSVKKHWQKVFPERDPSLFRLWVDAICVNQENNDEKSSQVQQMSSIYSSAELVIAWLGVESEKLSLAFDTCEILTREFEKAVPFPDQPPNSADIQWLSAYPSLCEVDDPDLEVTFDFQKNRRWAAFDHLLCLSYWERIWIAQECILAERLLLACPLRFMDYNTASKAAEAMFRFQESPLYVRPNFISSEVWSVFSEESFKLHLILGVDSVRLFFRYLRSSSPQQYSNSQELPLLVKADADMLQILAKMVEHKHATNPKDYIYGMLSLSGLEIVPDYSNLTPPYVAFVDYVKALLKTLHKEMKNSTDANKIYPLFFLYQAGIGFLNYPQGCPTWAPNYSAISESHIHDISSGTSINSSTTYYPEGLQIIKMRIKRFRLQPTVKERWLLLANKLGQASSEEETVAWIVDNFWTENEMSNNHFNRTTLLEYARQNFESVDERDIEEQVRLTVGLANTLRVFETESGHIGIGPLGSKPGDAVCLLCGSGVPVVLRIIDNHYVHVGTCFVSNFMDGQATWKEMGQTILQKFEIC
ncbi:hypothetical protein B7463_g5465, partial [Scytalidium lignicola]